MMNKEESMEKLRKRSTAVAEKHKRLEVALRQHKKAAERGDIYLFDLDAIPKDVAVFWVILHRHPKDPNLFFTVPADTNPLKGVFDVSIPSMALFGFLVLRLGQGIWLPDFVFNPSQRVGMVETLFIDRAQFIMSRIAKNEWIGNDMQQATEANPDYEEWTEMLDNVHANMMDLLGKQLVLKHEKDTASVYVHAPIIDGLRYVIDKSKEFFIDISGKGMRNIEGAFAPAYAYATRNAAAAQALSEEDKIGIAELKKSAPILPVKFLRKPQNIQINFQWLEQMIHAAPSVAMTLRGVEINPHDIAWQDKGNIQVLKVSNCIVLATEQEQAKSLLQIRFKDNKLYIDILPPVQDAQ